MSNIRNKRKTGAKTQVRSNEKKLGAKQKMLGTTKKKVRGNKKK